MGDISPPLFNISPERSELMWRKNKTTTDQTLLLKLVR